MSTETDYDSLVSCLVDSSDWQARDTAQKQLKLAGKAALPAIERKLDDPRWKARRTVAQLLDNALDDTNVHVLLRALKDQNAKVRRNALHSLSCEECKPQGCWNVDITGALLDRALTDRSPRVRIAAISYLGWSRPPEQRVVDGMMVLMATYDHPRVLVRAKRLHDESIKRLAAGVTQSAQATARIDI